MARYPKRGDDCEYTEDCMWGVDGWCDRPSHMKCVLANMEMNKKKYEENGNYEET